MVENNTRTDYLLNLLVRDCGRDEIEEFNSLPEDDTIELSKSYYKKRDKLLKTMGAKPSYSSFRRMASRVAAVFLLVVVISFGSMMTVSAWRGTIWNAFSNWYDSFVEVEYENEKDQTEGEPLTEIQQINTPSTLPAGVEELMVINNSSMIIYDYYKADEHVASFLQKLLDKDYVVNISSETATVSNKKIGDKRVTVVNENDEYITIFWNDDYYSYTMEGYNQATLEEMISSIK